MRGGKGRVGKRVGRCRRKREEERQAEREGRDWSALGRVSNRTAGSGGDLADTCESGKVFSQLRFLGGVGSLKKALS